MTDLHVETIELLLLVAAVVAMLARRFRFPYTVGLVLTGAALAVLPHAPRMTFTKDLVFSLLLPPLIFEAALSLSWSELRKVLPVVSVSATLGLLVSALLTGIGMHFLLDWPWISAGVFGVLIAATDPVSVVATFKEAGVAGRLRVLVESESLFNDGTAAVAFGLLLAFAGAGASPTVLGAAWTGIQVVGGGIGCGALVAVGFLYIAGKTTDHLVELAFTTVAAYGSFLLAEHFHVSGVLATLTAGLIIGNTGHLGSISRRGKESVDAFWEFAAFASNSLVFLLIGMQEIQQDFLPMLLPSAVAVAVVLAGRASAIYPIALLFSRSASRIQASHQHVMVWGGLRGALSLALALGLPESVPLRPQIVTVAFAVVAFSILVQGLTMGPLLRRLGLLHPPGHEGTVQ